MLIKRAKAYLIDGIIMMMILSLSLCIIYFAQISLGVYMTTNTKGNVLRLVFSWLFLFVVLYWYLGITSKLFHGSIGHFLTKLEVKPTLGNNTPFRFFVREFVFKHLLIFPIFFLPVLYLFAKELAVQYWYIFIIPILWIGVNIFYFTGTNDFIHDKILYTKVYDKFEEKEAH